jgi:uncharacterized protein (DUF433 family)
MFESLANDRIEFLTGNDGPLIRGTTIPVSAVLNALRAGRSPQAILPEFPELSGEDITAAIAYEKAAFRLRAEQWTHTAPLLQTIERRELREMTKEEHLRAIEAVLEVVTVSDDPRPTSGLVEFQRLLRSKT